LVVRILLADDEPDILMLYGDMLQGNGHEVVKAENGREVLEELAGGGFDLLVLDLFMPEIDGFRALKQLRDRGDEVPVIVMTGHFPDEVVNKGIQNSGVSEVLRKPVMISALLNAVNRVASETEG
jgi:CheY-like chemotaxis protein